MGQRTVDLTINGTDQMLDVQDRTSLVDSIRSTGLTGTHIGCEEGSCGACTVLIDGEPVRSCLTFAVQCSGRSITTIEGMAPDGELNEIQRALREHHGLQCGFCTPGFVIAITDLLASNPDPDDAEIDRALDGILCRCTGYVGIRRAVRSLRAVAQ